VESIFAVGPGVFRIQILFKFIIDHYYYSIIIDNFNFEDTKKAVQIIGLKCLTESSGNINEKTIREYANCGVNYISSGALTHSVYNMDLSLKAV
jgi:nicotinate-nucleotide pyrophosphorylase (carboxylating)